MKSPRSDPALAVAIAALAGLSGGFARAGGSTAPSPEAAAFLASNPGYVERAGSFYEKEYLSPALGQLSGMLVADEALRAALRDELVLFIREWLEAYVDQGGKMETRRLVAVLGRMDERMGKLLDRERLDAYWKWRIGETAEPNALGFLLKYQERPPAPAAPAGSAVAESLAEVERLAATPTVESTRRLVALMDAGDEIVRLHAARTVAERLPVPDYPGYGCPFTELRRDQVRRDLARKSWNGGLARDVRAHARQILGRGAIEEAGIGASILTCIGTVEDFPAVTAAMTRILDATANPEASPSYMPGSFDPFLMASQGLMYLGARPPAEPATSGEVAVALGALMIFPTERPEGWRDRCAAWKRHPVPYVRHIAAFVLETSAP